MTVEQLLQKRYKVIADYPFAAFSVGDIITPDPDGDIVLIDNVGQDNYSKVECLDEYPHLFQPLPWWADRKVEDMPECVKVTADNDHRFGGVYKVDKIRTDLNTPHFALDKEYWYGIEEIEPATLEQFNTFKQSQNER